MLKYAVIGAGGHAMIHIAPSRALGLEMLGVFDLNAHNAAEAIRASSCHEAKAYTSVAELLALPGLEAVVITSPDEFHPEQLAMAVQAGKHVLVDKPLAIDEAGLTIVRQALDLAARRGLIVASCHPRRFDPPYQWIKHNFAKLQEELGRLVRLEMDFSYHRPVAKWKAARSLLLDHFPHEIDFLRWLLGDAPVQAHRLVDGFDNYSVAGRTDDDVQFLFAGTRRLEARIFPEEIRLRFDRGDCTVNTKLGYSVVYRHETQKLSPERVPPTDYQGRFSAITREFVRAVREGSSELIDPGLIFNTASAIALAEQGSYRS